MRYVEDSLGRVPAPVVAIDHVCAWPNLTVMADGTIMAAIHNQPSHLKTPADIECWALTSTASAWEKRGMAAPRDTPSVARGNVAAGMAGNGDLVVISSGWSDPAAADNRGQVLPPLVSRSSDGGRTWAMDMQGFPADWPHAGRRPASPEGHLVPFGDILGGEDGHLRVGLYGGERGASCVYRSTDDGRTWREPVTFDPEAIIHEPALIHLGHGRWLAATRHDGLNLYVSDDDARSWVLRLEGLTGPAQHPGHLVQLRDGRVLLTFGNRQDPRGVDVRHSEDGGDTWSTPVRVADFTGDGGYPSSVPLPDGQIMTAYYARSIAGHDRYHMGTVVWDPRRSLQDV